MLGQSRNPFLNNLDDWIEILIVAVIIGGSALSAVAKWLIGYFSPKPDPMMDSRRAGGGTPRSSMRPAAPPVASPFPLSEMFGENEEVDRPVAKPLGEVRRSVVISLEESTPTAASPPPPPRIRKVAVQPSSRSAQAPRPGTGDSARLRQDARRPAPAEPRRAAESVAQHNKRREQEQQRREQSQEKRFAEFGLREDRQSQQVERRIGHVEAHISSEELALPETRSGSSPRVSTRFDSSEGPDWRRAVVLSEILAPPVSLRDAVSDQF